MPDHTTLAASTKDSSRALRRRLHIGAEYQGEGRTHVRVWAPAAERVEVVVDGRHTPLTAEADRYFAGTIDAVPGDCYQFRVGSDERLFPDPASRFQPRGPHGPSEIVDPSTFAWKD